jgi:transmembrane sensor
MSDFRLDPELAPIPEQGSYASYEPQDAQYREASQWLLQLRERNLTTSRAFEQWRDADPANRFAYAEIEAAFAASARPSRMVGGYFRRRFRIAPRAWHAMLGAVAATLLLVLGLSYRDQLAMIGADAGTVAGQQERVAMADGSHVSLNTRTVLDMTVTPETRGARLWRGEAYFDVAKDPARPFIVRAGDAQVRVLGTKFNVRIEDGRSIISVVEGHVRVASTKDPAKVADLVVGQEAVVDGGDVARRSADLYLVNAWRRGEVVVERVKLSAAIEQLNRYRAQPIYLFNRDLADDRITAIFPIHDPKRALRMMESMLGIKSITLPTGQAVLY